MRAGIALGANLGDRIASLTAARSQIFALPGVREPLLASSLYETEPVDCEPGAAKFLNAVVEIGYAGSSSEFFRELQRIEHALGRPAAHARNRSRTVDLDLLYHGDLLVAEPDLTLPHPRLHERAFVLQPLAEIRPDLILPNEPETIRQLVARLPATAAVVRFPEQW